MTTGWQYDARGNPRDIDPQRDTWRAALWRLVSWTLFSNDDGE